MRENVAISVKNVGMRFNLNQEHVDNLKEYFIKILKNKCPIRLTNIYIFYILCLLQADN